MFDGPFETDCNSARTFYELRDVMLEEMASNGLGQTLISGPISTGGVEDKGANLARFGEAICLHRRLGYRVVDVRPMEAAIKRLRQDWQSKGNTGYCWPILEVVYRGIIYSSRISRGIFLPDWATSVGSRWERQHLKNISAYIIDLPGNWLEPEYTSNVLADLAA